MVREKSNKNTSRDSKTRNITDRSWLESSIEVPKSTREYERERAVKELALCVDQGIEAGLHLPRSGNLQSFCYYHNDMPGTSRDALAEKAAIKRQIAEDEAESLERQTDERQLEILESEIDHERDPGEPPRDENAYESMDID